MVFVSSLKKKLYLTVANYFRFWANKSLKRWNPHILIVTGSAGKTTMLNLIESQLGKQAHYSHNANSPYGITLDILGLTGITNSKLKWIPLFFSAPFRSLKAQHDEPFYIVEADAERPHEAEWVATWLKPEASVWVTLGRSHAVFYEKIVAEGKFKDIDAAIAHEFSMIPSNTRNCVIIDGEDKYMCAATKNIKAKLV